MRTTIMVLGLPFSGKTSFIKNILPVELEGLGLKMEDVTLASTEAAYEAVYQAPIGRRRRRVPKKVTEELEKCLDPAISEGKDIIGESRLTLKKKNAKRLLKALDRLAKLEKTPKWKKICIYMDVPTEAIMNRNKAENEPFPPLLLSILCRRTRRPSFAEGWDEIWTVRSFSEDGSQWDIVKVKKAELPQ